MTSSKSCLQLMHYSLIYMLQSNAVTTCRNICQHTTSAVQATAAAPHGSKATVQATTQASIATAQAFVATAQAFVEAIAQAPTQSAVTAPAHALAYAYSKDSCRGPYSWFAQVSGLRHYNYH